MVVSVWDEELSIYMTRGTWKDLIEGKGVGAVTWLGEGKVRVERKKEKHGAVSHKKKTS
jgi:hypothetical protein